MTTTRLITIAKATVCGGKSVKPGDVVEASVKDAHYLTTTKAATYATDAPVAEKRGRKKAPINRMVDDAGLENRD